MATDEVKEQAALYALGALSQIEARRFESHLGEDCGVCWSELSQFEEVVGALGLDAPEAAPPTALRDRLLERIGTESRKTPSQGPSGRPVVPRQPQPAVTTVRTGSGWLAWAIAACLAIFSITMLIEWRRTNDQISEVRSQFLSRQVLIDRQKDALDEDRQVIGVLRSPGSATVDLIGNTDHTTPVGRVYVDNADKRWVVVADLEPAPAGKEYQLWFIAPGPVSAGMLKTDDLGHGFSVVQIPPGLSQIGAAAITLEPEGGSKQPTMPIRALGKIS
ncbi:MAG TPA: anti-sigma factor [Blastocatellia bacterium]